MRSKTPNTALPAILANTSLAIVNSKLVKAHGGTDAADADKTDKAEQWFNSSASAGAGSGPYVLKQYSTTSQIVALAEHEVLGREKADVLERRRAQHDRPDAADQRPAGLARGRDRPLLRSRRWASRATRTLEGSRRRRPGCSGCSRTTTPRSRASTSNKHFQQARPLRARLQVDRSASPGPARSRRPGSSRRCSSDRCPRAPRSSRTWRRRRPRWRRPGVGEPEDHARVPERPDDQRRAVRRRSPRRCRRTSRPPASTSSCRARRVGTWLHEVPRRQDGVRPLALGPGLSGPGGLPRLPPGELVGTPRRLAEGLGPGARALGAKVRVTTDDAARETLYRQIQKRLNAAARTSR